MKYYFLAFILSLTSVTSFAQQNQISNLGCATQTTNTEIQEVYDYVQHPSAYKTTAGVDTIPLTIHIVGTDNGSGRYQLDYLFRVLCELNTRYAPVNFYFYIKWPIVYHNNNTYYEHDFSSGFWMMNDNNVANTVNVYFVKDPAGACGYYSPGAGAVAIKNTCSAPTSTTLVHELGHYFGLPHTFYGWENGGTPSNPEKVTRNGFTANCSNAGDGFCDTDADYLSDRWNCPYKGVKTDGNGDLYHPDSSIYMSYATDGCMTRFSAQQIGRMQAKLTGSYQNLLNSKPPAYSDMSVPNILYPVDSVHSNFTKVIWNKVAGAEMYHVKISQKQPAIARQDTVVADTVFQISYAMADNNDYSVQISPLIGVNLCRTKMITKNFTYTNKTTPLSLANFSPFGSSIHLSPNPVYGNEVTIYIDAMPLGNYKIRLVSISGQVISEQTVVNSIGNVTVTIPVSTVLSGLYFAQVQGVGTNWIQKVTIAR
jgi:hypothetical protein